MNEELHPKVRGFGRDENLENLYESVSIKEQLRNSYRMLTLEQVDNILLTNENLSTLEEEVIEELFGRTKAKLAGAAANVGARAQNLKNRVTTGASNIGQKAGAIASNIGNAAAQVGNVATGKYNTGDLEAGQTNVSQVGNNQAQIQDPNAAANNAKLQAILPEIKKAVAGAYTSIDKNLAGLGLDANTLAQVDPEVAKAISYAKQWLKAAYTKLNG